MVDVPTNEVVRKWYRDVKGYDQRIVDSMDVDSEYTRDNGKEFYRVRHMPMPKYRVILVLKEPFPFVGAGVPHHERVKAWREYYMQVAAYLGFSTVDKACKNPSRMMYLPRYPHGTDLTGNLFEDEAACGVGVVRGEPLDLDAVLADAQPDNGSLLSKAAKKSGRIELQTPDLWDFLRGPPLPAGG